MQNSHQSIPKPKNTIIFLVIGNREDYYYQACFSLLSFLLKHPDCQYLLITDHASYFNRFKSNQNIKIHSVDPETLKSWYGVHQYFFRSKIKTMQLAHEFFPSSNLILVDSDTVLVNSFQKHLDLLSESQSCVFHCSEGPMHKRRGKTSKLIWGHLQNKTYQNILVPDDYCLMNSGALGFPNKGIKDTLESVLAINDILLDEKMPGFTHEQIAFNIAALGKCSSLETCEKDLLHYWGNKPEWLDSIKGFLAKCHLSQTDPLDEIAKVIPTYVSKLPVVRQKKGFAKRIDRISKKIPFKREIFFK